MATTKDIVKESDSIIENNAKTPTIDTNKKYPFKEFILNDLADITYIPIETNNDVLINNGTINIQCKWTVAGADGLTGTQGAKNVEYSKYCRLIENNTQAMEYYKKAKKFTDWLKNSVLKDLKYKDVML